MGPPISSEMQITLTEGGANYFYSVHSDFSARDHIAVHPRNQQDSKLAVIVRNRAIKGIMLCGTFLCILAFFNAVSRVDK